MLISKYNSRKIKVLNFVLIFLVLIIHSYYLEAAEYPMAMALQSFFGNNGLARVSVPMFFLLSGMLFFNNTEQISHCFQKQKKRVFSLLVPYLLWNLIFVFWYVVLQNLPMLKGFINSDLVGTLLKGGVIVGLKRSFWIPAAFHLWFLRDLLCMVIITPVLYYLIRYTKWLAPIIVFVAMYGLEFFHFFESIDYKVYRIDGIVFFCIGGCISMLSSLELIDRWFTRPVIAVAAVIFFGNAVWQIFASDINALYNFATAICGGIVVWKAYDWIALRSSQFSLNINTVSSRITSILGYSFFIYLFHEPVFNIIKKVGLKVFGVSEWSLILLYLVNPMVMCALAIVVAKFLQRYYPMIYGVLTGGR